MATGSAKTRHGPAQLSCATPLDEINREISHQGQNAFIAWLDESL
jgi:hypothetical protein